MYIQKVTIFWPFFVSWAQVSEQRFAIPSLSFLICSCPWPPGVTVFEGAFLGRGTTPLPSPVFLKGSSLTPDVNFWNIKPFFLHILRIFRVSQTHTHTHKIVLYGKMSNFLNHNKNLNFWKQEPYEKRR